MVILKTRIPSVSISRVRICLYRQILVTQVNRRNGNPQVMYNLFNANNSETNKICPSLYRNIECDPAFAATELLAGAKEIIRS
ncbi:hypothetical protein D3C81_1296450 [compost metagenome]